MQKPLILNEILFRRYYQEQNKYLKEKLKHVKPIVNSDCPKSFLFLKNKYQKNNICMYTFINNIIIYKL
jgi:hypothetical protein